MHTPEARIAFIVHGVVQQAMRDRGAKYVQLVGCERRQQELVLQWCDVAQSEAGGSVIVLSAANKTELLLGQPPLADVYPLGDLYASDLEELAGGFEVGQTAQRLADRAGGVRELDRALRGLLEERHEPDQAFAHIPQVRDDVLQQLENSRFRRLHIGVVPKIGARTLGIDLFI